MDPLVLCSSCHRHVKCTASACPFCAAALPSPRNNLQVAGVLVGLALGIAACGEAVSLYGAPPIDGGGGNTATASGSGGTGGTGGWTGGIGGAYAPPPHPDLPDP